MGLLGWTDGMSEQVDDEDGEYDEQELDGECEYKALTW